MPLLETPPRRQGRPPATPGRSTRERLLDAALALFAAHGLNGTSMKDIGNAVGVTDAAIYAHFASKQALFDALMERSGPALLATPEISIDALVELPPHQAVPRLVEALLTAWCKPERRQFTSVLLREGARSVSSALAQAQRTLQPALRTWVAQGHLRADVTVDVLAWELLAPLAAVRLAWLNAAASPQQRAQGRRLAGQHVAYFLKTATVDRTPAAKRRRK